MLRWAKSYSIHEGARLDVVGYKRSACIGGFLWEIAGSSRTALLCGRCSRVRVGVISRDTDLLTLSLSSGLRPRLRRELGQNSQNITLTIHNMN